MLRKKSLFIVHLWLAAALTACNLPGGGPQPTGTPDIEATVKARVEALFTPTVPIAPPPQDTPTLEFTLTPEATVTPSVPQVTVSMNTNCRTGPGTQYDQIGALLIGQSAEVVGKYSASNYWIIKTPGGMGNCWLWGQYATVTGNAAGLQEYAVPATPTPALPAAVENLQADITCVLQNFVNLVNVKLKWVDKASNEKGINIYRDGSLLISLAPDAQSYEDDTTLVAVWIPNTPQPSLTYTVQTFNDAGESPKREVNVKCP